MNDQPRSASSSRIATRPAGVQLNRACTGLREFLPHLIHHGKSKARMESGSPGSASFLQPLNHAVFRNSQPPLKASNENISLLPGEEDEAQNRQRVSRQLQATLVGFEAWFPGHFHLSTATFFLQGQLLSSTYNHCWMEDPGELRHGFHHSHAP